MVCVLGGLWQDPSDLAVHAIEAGVLSDFSPPCAPSAWDAAGAQEDFVD